MRFQMDLMEMERTICAFDFDGTLSPVVPDRRSAEMDPACRAFLTELTDNPAITVAIVSTRDLPDLVHRIAIPNVTLIANGGLVWQTLDGEIHQPSEQDRKLLDETRNRLIPQLRSLERFPGLELEDKTWSFSVHFRNVPPEYRSELASSLDSIRLTGDVPLRRGPEAVELPFIGNADKGTALRRFANTVRKLHGAARLVFAGDDQNDLPAIRYALSEGGAAFTVGNLISVPGAIHVSAPRLLPDAVRVAMLSEAARG